MIMISDSPWAVLEETWSSRLSREQGKCWKHGDEGLNELGIPNA